MKRIVNKATGEIIDLEYKSNEELAGKLYLLRKTITSLNLLNKKMTDEAKKIMADEPEVKAGKYRLFKKTSQYKGYDPVLLKSVLEEDLRDLVMVPDKKKIEELLPQWVKEGVVEEEAWKELRDCMIVNRTQEVLTIEKE